MSELRARLSSSRLYLVTDGSRSDLPQFLDAVLSAGVDVVQLRDKRAEASEILVLAKVFRDACDRHGALLFVNDRVDLAMAAGADGVHLGQQDLPPEPARAMLGPDRLIGRSTHTSDQMHAALEEQADYFCVGPVYATPTKPGRAATGLDLVRLAAKQDAKPWFAIGGIDSSNVDLVSEAGARRIVVVRAIAEAPDPAAAARSLRDRLSDSLYAPP